MEIFDFNLNGVLEISHQIQRPIVEMTQEVT